MLLHDVEERRVPFERIRTKGDAGWHGACGEDLKEWLRADRNTEADLRGRVITITDNRTVVAHRPSRRRQIDKYTGQGGAIGKPASGCCSPPVWNNDFGPFSFTFHAMIRSFFFFFYYARWTAQLYQWPMTNCIDDLTLYQRHPRDPLDLVLKREASVSTVVRSFSWKRILFPRKLSKFEHAWKC